MADLRDEILKDVAGAVVTACVIAEEDGVIAGSCDAAREAERLDLRVRKVVPEGTSVRAGDHVIEFSGTPSRVAAAEERLMGLMAKPSGIATAVHRFIAAAGDGLEIVCGAWKKMPPQLKDSIRAAIVVGGGRFRISREPFIYLDKNLVEMLGGIRESLESVARLDGYVRVVQIKGRRGDIAQEAREAVEAGADILCIDTGRPSDVERVSAALRERGLRGRVRIALAGGIRFRDLEALKQADVDILDVGREIVDAPLLDMRMEVLSVDGA